MRYGRLPDGDNDAVIDKDGYASEDVSEVENDDETPSGRHAMGNGIQPTRPFLPHMMV